MTFKRIVHSTPFVEMTGIAPKDNPRRLFALLFGLTFTLTVYKSQCEIASRRLGLVEGP